MLSLDYFFGVMLDITFIESHMNFANSWVTWVRKAKTVVTRASSSHVFVVGKYPCSLREHEKRRDVSRIGLKLEHCP